MKPRLITDEQEARRVARQVESWSPQFEEQVVEQARQNRRHEQQVAAGRDAEARRFWFGQWS